MIENIYINHKWTQILLKFLSLFFLFKGSAIARKKFSLFQEGYNENKYIFWEVNK